MDTANTILQKLEQFKDVLLRRATGNAEPDDIDTYTTLRREIVAQNHLLPLLPSFVQDHRTLNEFWGFIKNQFASYQERREYLRTQFDPIFRVLEKESLSTHEPNDLFKQQFPAGLPFGLKKPSVAILPSKRNQTIRFEEEPGIGVLREKVYPSLTHNKAQTLIAHQSVAQPTLGTSLLQLIQTASEQAFFLHYANMFNMLNENVPLLIPQAWIQWHSKTKQDLRSQSSGYADDLYRVDFVVFWKQKRFALLLDDIGHYARKISSDWIANEERYSQRLKEDRKLRKEGWDVFRISNWEMRDDTLINDILNDLREFIDF